ncbi:hypothetical protein IAU60_001209 [Kwoniella sp. DSM 27419]
MSLEKDRDYAASVTAADTHHFYISGKDEFVGELGGNGAQATIQDASGAPVETVNPLGYSVGWWSALFLNITMLIGTGIFSFLVYLEQAYRKPKYFFPVAFAVQTVVLSFVSSNCIAIWLSTNASLRLSNTFGVIKLATLLIIIIPGFMALGGYFDAVPNPKANFRNAFEGTRNNGYSLSNALVNIIFSYGGYTNSFNMANEIKNPIQTIKRTANTAVISVAILYMLTNIAYFAVSSTEVTASLFWQKLFGDKVAKGLTLLPVLSASSNILNVMVGHSRMIREIGRWVVVALQNYPSSFFLALMTFGLFIVRRDRRRLNLPRPEYRSWTFVVVFFLATNVFLLIMPWVPPAGGINNSSFGFFYGASVFLCALYFVLWAKWLPKLGGYQLRQTVVTLPDGALTHKMIRVKNEEVDAWDAKHDPSGRSLSEGYGYA